MAEESRVTFAAAGLTLEGRLQAPAGATRAAVLCHPHPQYGGSMDNSVVDGLVSALRAVGFATLRFNFRGVGASEGAYGGGVAECDDARGAVAWLRERLGLSTVALAGYSFGSIVALRAGCDDPSVDRVVAVAPPLAMIGIDGLGSCAKPKLLIVGDADQYCSVASLERAARDLPAPTESYVVQQTGHFFGGREDEVGRRVADFLSQ